MASLRILAPDGTVNYVENPAFRYNTNGWTAAGATLTRVLNPARWNVASMKIVTNGSALQEGAYYRVSRLAGVNEAVTGSAYVRGSGWARVRLIDYPAGKEWASLPAMSLPSVAQGKAAPSTNYNSTRNYTLNVNTSANTEPIIADFNMMESLAG